MPVRKYLPGPPCCHPLRSARREADRGVLVRFVRPSAQGCDGQAVYQRPAVRDSCCAPCSESNGSRRASLRHRSVARVRRRRVPRRDLEATCRPRPRRRWGCRHPRRTVRVIDNDATRRPDRGGPDHRFWGRHKAGCCRRWRERMRGSADRSGGGTSFSERRDRRRHRERRRRYRRRRSNDRRDG